jgi:hypothetical protein
MSINNLEFTSYNYLSNLASVNADEVNTDVLTKSNPDITDLQFDMLEGINTNETIQQQIDGVTGDVSTLQSEMNTAQDDINDLQSDVIALYSISSANTAAIAGLSVSQAAQDVIIATHTGQITTLQGDVNDAEDDINALQTKTQHQSATGFRTIFATTVEVGGVSLNTNSASTFDDGLSASAAITSSAGTSQFSSLLVNTSAEVTNDLTITDGEIYIRRNTLTASKKLILYDNTTGNDYDYLGFWTDSGTASKKFLNAEIDGVAGSAFQWYAGDGAGTSRTLLKQVTSANEIGLTPLATFLKTNGFSQQIQMVKDAPNNIVRIDMLGDTAGVNAFDGQIIQAEGNGLDDNRGTMTIQSGGLAINALNTGLNVQATTSTLIQSGTTTTLTSGGETEINSAALDINATGAITIDSTGTLSLTSSTNTILGTTNINRTGIAATSIGNTGALTLNGSTYNLTTTGNQIYSTASTANMVFTAGDFLFTSIGTTVGEFVVRANTNIDLKTTTGSIEINATTTTLLRSGPLGSNTIRIDATDKMVTNATTTTITNTTVAINGVTNITGATTVAGVTNINATGANATNIGNASSTTTQLGTTNINATGSNATNIGNASSTTTIGGPTTINGATTINGNTAVNVDNTFNLMPTATIIQNVSATVPAGFLLCNGDAVNRVGTYARLFAVISTTFGPGNGITTFNVPNFLGAFLRGSGTQTVGGVAYAGAAVGTAQQDAVLNPLYASNEGYFNTTSGGATRECVSRNRIGADPVDTNTGILPRFDRTATENRPFNYTVYYYIRY